MYLIKTVPKINKNGYNLIIKRQCMFIKNKKLKRKRPMQFLKRAKNLNRHLTTWLLAMENSWQFLINLPKRNENIYPHQDL